MSSAEIAQLHARVAMLERQVLRLATRLRAGVAFGRTTKDAADGGPVQDLQVQQSSLELHDSVTHVQAYGFASSPPPGTDTVTVYLGADRGAGVVVATNHQGSRPTNMARGDSVMHNDTGVMIRVTASGVIIHGNGQPTLVEGDLRVTGAVYQGWGGSGQVGLGSHRHDQPSDGHGDSEARTTAPVAGT